MSAACHNIMLVNCACILKLLLQYADMGNMCTIFLFVVILMYAHIVQAEASIYSAVHHVSLLCKGTCNPIIAAYPCNVCIVRLTYLEEIL